ncbi:hypothetical protein PVAP13_5NG293736 [Panicum virgatum]|uniref:Membrane-associated kinase regulator 2 n=1 Tax=Panicum virgatum TaxID=38727 RepID=A0A8T0RZK7_PANVG|nr:hypothetical protein PVAP13_5NG293736 [Panicum virgatum]
MQILRLVAARRFRRRRRAVSTITAAATAPVTLRAGYAYGEDEDEGPFFDLDLSCCSAPASAAGSQAAESGSESDDYAASCPAAAAERGGLDFVISLQRSRSASPSYEERLFFRGAAAAAAATPLPLPLMFCASEPSDAASRARRSSAGSRRLQLRTLSFGSAKAALYGGRASFSRSASSSARSASRLFAAYGGGSPGAQEARARPPSGDVFRRYLSKISSRLRRGAAAPAAAADLRLRKSRSASAAQSPPARRDDSLAEKQDGIASAIAHCKESLHRGPSPSHTSADAVALTPPRASCPAIVIILRSVPLFSNAPVPCAPQRPSPSSTRRCCGRGATRGRE